MVLQKHDYYLSFLAVAHGFFMRVEIACGFSKKTIRLIVNFFYNLERNVVKWLTLTGKQTEKEHTEEDHFNLSSDNVYLLFVSFCRFHENFDLN